MARVAPSTESSPEEFSEKEFYLDEFRGHTIVFAVGRDLLCQAGGGEALADVVRDLLHNDTRAIVLVDGDDDLAGAVRSVRRRLDSALFRDDVLTLLPHLRARAARAAVFAPLDAGDSLPATTLARIWAVLRHTPVFVGIVPCAAERLADFGQNLAARLRVHKLVLIEEAGGVADADGRQMSFLDGHMLDALLHHGEAESTGLAHRRDTLEAVSRGLDGGVAAINLCSLVGLARELFTYDGSGTLFTDEDYCRIAPLGIDDFEEVERLIERGQREGFLKPRSPEEIAQIVLCGFGATIGGHHLAGMCALVSEPYERERAGEIVALYTITRFKGEGVGGKLLAHVEEEARRRGLDYVFAVTTEARAQLFFERSGFTRVSPADVPAAKWEAYEPARLAAVSVYRRPVGELA